jgi:hypothetical protein
VRGSRDQRGEEKRSNHQCRRRRSPEEEEGTSPHSDKDPTRRSEGVILARDSPGRSRDHVKRWRQCPHCYCRLEEDEYPAPLQQQEEEQQLQEDPFASLCFELVSRSDETVLLCEEEEGRSCPHSHQNIEQWLGQQAAPCGEIFSSQWHQWTWHE